MDEPNKNQSAAKIALVEDDEMLAEIYQIRLQLAGFDCRTAHDGLSAIGMVRDYMPDLLLLDFMLPQLSGDEVLKVIRDSNWGKTLKVIMLTNISESEAPASLQTLGLERYIVKANLVNNQLAEIVAECLGLPPPETE